MQLAPPHLLDQAKTHYAAAQYAQAHAAAQACVSAAPQFAEAHFWLALSSTGLGRQPAALAAYAQAVMLNPYCASYHYNFAVSLAEAGKVDQAMLRYQDCLRIEPDHMDALWNLSEHLRIRLHTAAALACLQRLEALGCRYPGINQRTACAHVCLGDYAKGDEYFALEAQNPLDCDLLMWEWAHGLQAQGRYPQAWQAYAHRFAVGDKVNVHRHPFTQPEWLGQALAGKTILLHGEQGLGDEIMFTSIVPDVQALAANVVLAVRPALVNLFARSLPGVRVVAHTVGAACADLSACPPIDFQCPLGSLPAQLRNTLAEFESARMPYLAADPGMVQGFERLLAHHAGARGLTDSAQPTPRKLRVGLAWAGNPITKHAKRKSMTIEQVNAGLAGLPNVQFVSLLNADIGATAGDAPELNMIDVSYALTDFNVTAALVESVDLVLSVCTSLSHLGGAMGKPCWLLAANPADCRWGNTGERNPWYPSVRVLRQAKDGSGWAGLLAKVKDELAQLQPSDFDPNFKSNEAA